MGYQESYVKVNSSDYNKFINIIKENSVEYYENINCYPILIIEFVKNHHPFKIGDKVVYIVGERYYQNNLNRLFGNNINNISYNIYPTESVNPIGIWKDSGEVTDVICEEIKYNLN